MYKEDDDTALLALRGGLRGRFRRSLDSMENAFEALQDSLERTTSPAQRAELQPIFDELCTQLLSLRRLGDQTSDAATAALLRGSCTPRPMDLVSQLREICDILQEEAARCGLPFTVELCCATLWRFLPPKSSRVICGWSMPAAAPRAMYRCTWAAMPGLSALPDTVWA